MENRLSQATGTSGAANDRQVEPTPIAYILISAGAEADWLPNYGNVSATRAYETMATECADSPTYEWRRIKKSPKLTILACVTGKIRVY